MYSSWISGHVKVVSVDARDSDFSDSVSGHAFGICFDAPSGVWSHRGLWAS